MGNFFQNISMTLQTTILISSLLFLFNFSFAEEGKKEKKYSVTLESFENPICTTDSFRVKALGKHPCKKKGIEYEWYANGKLIKTTNSNMLSLSSTHNGDEVHVVVSCKKHRKPLRFTSPSITVNFKECSFYNNYHIISAFDASVAQSTLLIESTLEKKPLNIKLYDSQGKVIYTGEHVVNERILLGDEPLKGNHFLEIEIDHVITHKLISFE